MTWARTSRGAKTALGAGVLLACLPSAALAQDLVRVPQDRTSLALAVADVNPGGVVEIDGAAFTP
mgnify:CR=1 FL=1